jgi:hypothetical protein
MNKVRDAALNYDKALGRLPNTYGNVNDAMGEAKRKSDQQLEALIKLGGGVSDSVQKQQDLTAAVKGTTTAHANLTGASGTLRDAVTKTGVTVSSVWDANTVILHSATLKQIQDLANLGKTVLGLPNGDIVVTTDTRDAKLGIQELLAWARDQSIVLRATMPSLVNNAITSGSGRMGTYAAGGLIQGPGTGTSDSIPIMASNNEFIVNAAATQANLALLHAINNGAIKGYANGGVVIPTSVDSASIAAIHGQIGAASKAYSAALAGGAPGNVTGNAAIVQRVAGQYGWGSGAEWDSLYRVVMRESGFRNTAQNPTSTAYGMGQFLDSTWSQLRPQRWPCLPAPR